ncbi:MAG: mechanosensitive ion channel family protein [Spirochaetaceae bacterium]|nr:MAG: mechanosensitive ion channel family protein [Spirochaetaceae bacterium]
MIRDQIVSTALPLLQDFGMRAILAIALLLVGSILVRGVSRAVRRGLERAHVDTGLTGFLSSITRTALNVVLILAAASTLGVQMTSFVALVGAAGLAVGLAFQGALSNFAGGVLILVTRPFAVGDFVEAGGHLGSVVEIQVLYTLLNTPDNRRVVIPNGNLANSAVVNFSVNPTRRIDMTISISYHDEIARAREIILAVLQDTGAVLPDPAPVIGVSGHGASSIDILVRFWCRREDWLTVQHELYEQIKVRFDRESITIPFPQRYLHLADSGGAILR